MLISLEGEGVASHQTGAIREMGSVYVRGAHLHGHQSIFC